MPTVDPAAALEARLAELDAAIKPLAEERARVERALAALRGLTSRNQSATNGGMGHAMHAVERLRHSKGARHAATTRRLIDVAHAAGHTLRSLAADLGTTQATLSRATLPKSHAGHRSISSELAERARIATVSDAYPKGYEVTLANWPGLRSAE